MALEDMAKFADAMARLIGALAWPSVAIFALRLLGPSIHRFLFTLTEIRLKGAGSKRPRAGASISIQAVRYYSISGSRMVRLIGRTRFGSGHA
jgi:hypothetical protein